MKKEAIKSSIFILLIITILAIFSTLVFASLVCEVKEAACSQAEVFHLSSQTNAHAQLATETGYEWNVCCELQDVADTLDTSCTSPDAYVTALSSDTNAHVERYGETDYGSNVCLSASSGRIVCQTENKPSCYTDIGEVCVFTQSGQTNAHAADCGAEAYDWKTCCRLISDTTCEDDCTHIGDNTIHRECDGINGCEFCDAARGCGFCDKSKVGDSCDLAQPGWIREYYDDTPARCDDGCEIECAEGCPKAKLKKKAKVTCEYENLIKLTKLITYKGKLTKLVVVVCG